MKSEIQDREVLSKILAKERQNGKIIVFTNGCFDLLHAGHVRYLNAARKQGDLLVVGLNSDASVRSIKGEKRPIVPQEQRAEVLAGLECVDYVSIFDEPDPLRLIQSLKPHVLAKGADWAEENIIGGDFVKSIGGRVERIHLVPGASTTAIIERILQLYQKERQC